MKLEKPTLVYISPLPPKKGGFYYREQHMNALKEYFNVEPEETEPRLLHQILAIPIGILLFILSPISVLITRYILNFKLTTYYEYDFGAYKERPLLFPAALYERMHGGINIFRLHEDYGNLSYGALIRFWDNFWLRIVATKIIVHTKEHKKQLWPANQMKTEILLSGLDLIKRKKKVNGNAIIVPGFISRWKGHDILIHAFAEVVKKIPSAKLVIAGKVHDKDFFRHISNLLLIYDLLGSVELHTEYLKRQEMNKLLNSAKLAVLPYRRITFSAALLDCLDWEIPAILSNIPSFRELGGKLPRFNNSEELAKLMINLLKDKKQYKEALRVTKELKKEYDWKPIVKKEAEMIYRLI